MANFKNTGDLYVSKSGSDANAGTDPNLPKLTIQGALSVAVSGNDIIIGDGIYTEESINLSLNPANLIGDGVVILEGDNNNTGLIVGVGANHSASNLILVNYLTPISGGSQDCRGFQTSNIIVIGGSLSNFGSQSSIASFSFNGLRLINSSIETGLNQSGEVTGVTNCVLKNGQFKNLYNDYFLGIKNCSFENYTLFLEDIDISKKFSFCNFFNCTFIYNGASYTSLSSIQVVVGGFTNCTELDPLFNNVSGEVETLDFNVKGSSPLLGSGENGTNIGGVKRGLSQDRFSDSVQNGTNTNIVFDGNVWQVQNGQTTGTIETAVIDFGLTVKSPKLTVKGLVNFLDNVPDFDNALTNPNKLDVEARYAIIGEDISVKAYKPFLLNEKILLDVGGLSNGEALFDWTNTVTQPMKEIQLRITLRQDYNPS